MKTIRKEPCKLIEVEGFPHLTDFEANTAYYNPEKKYGLMKCLCGCGVLCGFNGSWNITSKEPFTLDGSIQVDGGCNSHYIITNGIANFV